MDPQLMGFLQMLAGQSGQQQGQPSQGQYGSASPMGGGIGIMDLMGGGQGGAGDDVAGDGGGMGVMSLLPGMFGGGAQPPGATPAPGSDQTASLGQNMTQVPPQSPVGTLQNNDMYSAMMAPPPAPNYWAPMQNLMGR